MIRKRLKQLKDFDPTSIHKGVNKSINKIKSINPEQVEEHLSKFQIEVRKHMGTAISAAFALVIALVWKDAIQAFVDTLLKKFNITENLHLYKLVVAIVVTIVCAAGIWIVSKWSEQKIKEEEEKKSRKKKKK
jgi:hypothetical protein